MSHKSLYYFFLAVILIGLTDSMYLSLTVLLDISPVCGPLHGCETVAASSYSKLLGVPLAYLGTLYYAAGAVLAPFLLVSHFARILGVLYGGVGTLMSLWFVYIQAVLIQAFCIYCLMSAVATFFVLWLTYTLWKKESLVSPPAF